MHITLYRSKFCPRCYIAKKNIQELISHHPDISYKEIDVVTCPVKSWHEGIRMIPAIKIEHEILSGTLLTRLQIKNFIKKYNHK